MATKTYKFRVVIEPDEDFYTSIPWFTRGAQGMVEHGERIPEEPADQMEVSVEPRVAVTI